ncbi:hypothetical protein [Nocardioides houyundeii]|uniref:hypothetical protein n=1 Tax=Nocardioides houyundeii TaxID=2045452 RepID=UPI001315ABF8|nr:hypothetical protein [Nocardioides houyundeii]
MSTTPTPTHMTTAEQWFLGHGLPYFVDDVRARVSHGLGRGRLRAVLAASVLVAGTAFIVGALVSDRYTGAAAALTSAGVVLGLYALATLQVRLWLRWAVRKTLSSLELMIPLVARALPMLMLFITFLFINAEVWEVAARLSGGVMWTAVLGFAAAAVGFLASRLPEELDAFTAELDPSRIEEACAGTPFAAWSRGVGIGTAVASPSRLERANLILVLLAAQAIQVLLLSVAVFVFFIGFGIVAIPDEVAANWVGTDPTPALGAISWELVRVAVFLAAFSGLYFAVYAVTDEAYRRQFFTDVTDELRTAVSTRAVYRAMRDGAQR